MSDPFQSLRGVAAAVDPDHEFVEAVMQAVRERLEPSSTDRLPTDRLPTTRTDLPEMEAVATTPEPTERARSTRWWVVAAAWVAVVAGGLTALAVVREEPALPASDAPASDDTLAPATLMTVPPINWNDLHLEDQGSFPQLEPGRYLIDPDGDAATPLTVTYDLPEGWRHWFGGLRSYPGGEVIVSITTVSNLVADGCGGDRAADPTVGSTVDDLAMALAELAPFEVTSAPADVSAFSYEGKYVQLTVPDMSIEDFAACDPRSWFGPLNGGEPFHFYNAPGVVEEFWILDVDGTRLVLTTLWAPNSPDDAVAEMRAVFDSISIQPCGPAGPAQKGNDMNRWAIPAAGAAAAVMLLGACGDDGPTTVAEGQDVELVGEEDLGGQTLNISAEDDDGNVTGEIRFTDSGGEVVVTVECADTDTDGVVVVGGTVTESTDDSMTGELTALFIKDGDPDRVAVWVNDDEENQTCSDLIQNRRDVLDEDQYFVDVESGSDIVTG